MASGYDIGVSSSTALSYADNLNTNAGAVFNFSSPGASGDWYGPQSQSATPEATAVATAKSPDSPISLGSGPNGAGGGAAGSGGSGVGGLSNVQLGIAALTIIAVVFFLRK